MSTYCIKEFGNTAHLYSIFLSVRFHLCFLFCLFANIFVLLSFCLSISFLTCQMLRSYKHLPLFLFTFYEPSSTFPEFSFQPSVCNFCPFFLLKIFFDWMKGIFSFLGADKSVFGSGSPVTKTL